MKLDRETAAIVTGGASGLGEATARALAERGVRVALFDLQEERGLEVAQAIGGTYCRVDVRDEASVDSGFAAARAAHGQESVLVCCAGLGRAGKTASRSRDDGSISHYPVDVFDAIIQVNLVGTFRCVAKAAAGMMTLDRRADAERGAIVMTSSVAANEGQMGQVSYAAAKAGIAGMTLPIARDLMSEGIRINTIQPGLFDTPLLQKLPEQVLTALAASVPFPKRLGHPREFAQMVIALIENGYANGETIRLDGAIRMPPR